MIQAAKRHPVIIIVILMILVETLASLGSVRAILQAGGAREPNRINFQHETTYYKAIAKKS